MVVVIGAGQYVFNAESRDRYNYLRAEVERMQGLNSDLEFENERLRLEVHGIENDDRYKEQISREEFGMIREGELLYQFNAPTP